MTEVRRCKSISECFAYFMYAVSQGCQSIAGREHTDEQHCNSRGDWGPEGSHEPGGLKSSLAFPAQHCLGLPDKDITGAMDEAKSQDAVSVVYNTF